MPGLGRNAPRLLSMVNGKPHASVADHEDYHSDSSELSDPPADDPNENIFREPESSSDEEPPPSVYQPPANKKPIRAPRRGPSNGNHTNIHAVSGQGKENGQEHKVQESTASGAFKKPKTEEPEQITSPKGKRAFLAPKSSVGKRSVRDEDSSAKSDWVTQSSQEASRKRQKLYGSQGGSQKAKVTGKTTTKGQNGIKHPKGPLTDHKSPKKKIKNTTEGSSQMGPSSQSTTGFRRPAGPEEDDLGEDAPLQDPYEASSPLSMRSTPPTDGIEINPIDLSSQPTTMTSPCQLCGEQVDSSFKEDFEIQNCRGRHMSYRMQERFCQAHKSRKAERTWQDRSYPKVDWTALEERLKKHRAHIQAVLDQKVTSHYREELEKAVQEGNTRTALRSLNAGKGSGTNVGYYGTRGQKMMTDYILQAFSSKLRRLAATDKLISATGISGGVSGYVHSVLVPELATSLVMEDAGVDADKARDIIVESSDIGELLNAEEDDERVPRSVAEAPVLSYGDEDAEGAVQRVGVI